MQRTFAKFLFLAPLITFIGGIGPVMAAPAPEGQVAAAAVVQPGQILPHRAFYKMTLDSARNDSEVKAADGLMMFEWQDACDGWIVQQRLDVQLTHEDAENGAHLVTNYATWESKDGLRYNFNYKSTVNDNPYENFRGTAMLDGVGKPGLATFSSPEEKEVKLPAGTLFPTSHTLALINAATQKQTLLTATVFDGTDAQGMSEISAVIGAAQPVKDPQALAGSPDNGKLAWPLRMAFFDMEDSNKAEPEYEMDSNMLPNGVSEFMLIDYGKYRLRGTLQKIELLPKPHC